MTPLSPSVDLKVDEWPDVTKIRATCWNADRTALIFHLADGSQEVLQIREPKPVKHVDLTVAERVDAVLSERMR